MATFGARVQDYVGTFSNTDLLDDTLTAGARIVIDLLAVKEEALNPIHSRLELYATDKTDAGTGIDITGGRAINAHKSSYGARKVSQRLIAQVAAAASIHFAVATDPVWYLLKNEAFVLPGGGVVRWVAYPTVADSDSAVSNFPPEGYPVFVLYSAVQCQMSIISTLVVTTIGGISYTAPTNVTPPGAPSFTWTDATGTTIDLATVSISNTLTFSPPVFGGSYANAETALGDEDIELAGGHLSKINQQLQEYNTDLQRQLSEFNKEAKQYDNELQEAITQAGIDAQRASAQAGLTQNLKLQNEINDYRQDVEEYQADLGKYQADIQDYAAQVGEEVQRIGTIVGQYSLMSQSHLALLKELRQEYQQILGTI